MQRAELPDDVDINNEEALSSIVLEEISDHETKSKKNPTKKRKRDGKIEIAAHDFGFNTTQSVNLFMKGYGSGYHFGMVSNNILDSKISPEGDAYEAGYQYGFQLANMRITKGHQEYNKGAKLGVAHARGDYCKYTEEELKAKNKSAQYIQGYFHGYDYYNKPKPRKKQKVNNESIESHTVTTINMPPIVGTSNSPNIPAIVNPVYSIDNSRPSLSGFFGSINQRQPEPSKSLELEEFNPLATLADIATLADKI